MNDELFEQALRILPGLLASGHYTIDAKDSDAIDEGTALIVVDNGKDWKEFSPSRFSPLAVMDALSLVQHLKEEAENFLKPLK